MNEHINYYELLGIKKDATDQEIKTAYRTQAKKWHPDINKTKEATNITKQLNEAKNVLLNKEKRQEYDEYLEYLTKSNFANLKEKTTKTKESTSKNDHHSSKDYQNKSYTKWEYFITYLKYYQTSYPRKILAIILVLLETIICSILQLINYLIVLIIVYAGNIFSYLVSLIIGLYIILIVINTLLKTSSSFQNIGEWLTALITIIAGLFIINLPTLVLPFFINKMPIYLSNLNIYLFKKSVGYKN